MISIHSYNKFITGFSSLIIVLGIFTVGIHRVHAAAGAIQVTVTQEGDGALRPGASVAVKCTGGSYSDLGITNGFGVIVDIPAGPASCDNGDSVDIRVTQTGLVTKTVVGAGFFSSAADPNIFTVSDFQFQLKVVTADELGNPYDAFNVVDTPTYNSMTAQLFSGANIYFLGNASNAPLMMQVSNGGGHVFAETTNVGFLDVSTSAANQTIITLGDYSPRATAVTAGSSVTAKGFMYGHKIIITREGDDAPLTGVNIGGPAFEIGPAGTYYTPIPVAFDGASGTITKSGYVDTVINVPDRTSGASPQAVTTISDVPFAQKIIVTRQSDGDPVSGATVTAGSQDTECIEGGSTGIYYCPVPTTEDGGLNDITISATGYSTDTTGDTVDRADDSSAQGVISIVLDDVPPVISSVTPISNSSISPTDSVTYSLSEEVEGTITFTRTGGAVDAQGTHVYNLSSGDTTAGAHTISLTTINSSPTFSSVNGLVDGAIYTIHIDATDMAGNDAIQIELSLVTYAIPRPVRSLRTGGSVSKSVNPQVGQTTQIKSILSPGICPSNVHVRTLMKQGMRSDEVKLLQGHINRILATRYSQAAGGTDGIFGPLTRKGVIRLQVVLRDELRLDLGPAGVDGIVGVFTRNAINNSCGKV